MKIYVENHRQHFYRAAHHEEQVNKKNACREGVRRAVNLATLQCSASRAARRLSGVARSSRFTSRRAVEGQICRDKHQRVIVTYPSQFADFVGI